MKKYKLTNEILKLINGIVLHRIIAVKDFKDVKAGQRGGWIERKDNLSQNGDCWIYDDAKVFGNAVVRDNAEVKDTAMVYCNASIYDNAKVYDRAHVYGNANVFDCAHVYGNAQVYRDALIYGNASVFDNAKVHINAFVRDNARVYGNAEVRGALIEDFAQVCGNALLFSCDDAHDSDIISDSIFKQLNKNN